MDKAEISFQKALLLLDRGKIERGEECLRDAISLFQSTQNRAGLLQAQCCLGDLLVQLGREEEALPLLKTVVEADRPPLGLFLVLIGRLELTPVGGTGSTAPLSLRDGDIFGEESAELDATSHATVVATTFSQLIRVEPSTLRELISDHPELPSLLASESRRRTSED